MPGTRSLWGYVQGSMSRVGGGYVQGVDIDHLPLNLVVATTHTVAKRVVRILLACFRITVRNEVPKVMFYRHLSVHRGGGVCLPQCMFWIPHICKLRADTPRSRHPLDSDTPPLGCRHPLPEPGTPPQGLSTLPSRTKYTPLGLSTPLPRD